MVRRSSTLTPDGAATPSRRPPPRWAAAYAALAPGARVVARYQRGVRWYPGTLGDLRPDGTARICYDDGDVDAATAGQEARVNARMEAHALGRCCLQGGGEVGPRLKKPLATKN